MHKLILKYNYSPPGMEQSKEGPIQHHSVVPLYYQNGAGWEVPRRDSPVPQCAKTGANKFWTQPAMAHIPRIAAELEKKVPLRSEGSPGSEAWMRSGLPSRAWTHVWAGLGLHPTGGTTEKELRRITLNRALREAASAKFADGCRSVVKLLLSRKNFSL
jgi:hypothetical protein